MWEENQDTLSRTFLFADFRDAMGFIVKIGLLAEKMNHHPTITNTYNSVRIDLTTHDAGNTVTDLDREMSQIIDSFL